MAIIVTINSITNGVPPYDIYICESGGSTNCCFLGTYDPLVDTPPLIYYVLTPPCDTFNNPFLKFIDNAVPSCEVFEGLSYTFTITINNTSYFAPLSTVPYQFIYDNNGILTSVDWNGGSNVNTYSSTALQTASYLYTGAFSGEIVVSSSTNFSQFTYLDTSTSGIPIASASTIQSYFYTTEMSKLFALEEYRNVQGVLYFSGAVSDFPSSLLTMYVNMFELTGSYFDLPTNMIYLALESVTAGNNSISDVVGDTLDLPRTMTHFMNIGGGTNFGGNSITGTFLDLPPVLEKMRIGQDNSSIIDDISNLPTTLNYFRHDRSTSSNSDYFGDLSGISSKPLEVFIIALQNNTITGDINSLPKIMTHVSIAGSNTIYGDISGAPATITNVTASDSNFFQGRGEFIIGGYNTISGVTADFPFTGTNYTINIGGLNTISGPLSLNHLTGSDIRIRITGNNTISGDGSGLAPGITQFFVFQTIDGPNDSIGIQTGNTLNGNISTYGNGSLTSLILGGANTVSGLTSDIPSTITSLSLYGFNTLSGDIQFIPSGMITFEVGGNNTLFGNITNLHTGYQTFRVTGNNTISGNLSNLNLPSCHTFVVTGGNTISISGALGFTIFNLMREINIQPVTPFTTSETDSFFNYLVANGYSFLQGPVARTITLRSVGRTAASNTAVDTLTGTPLNVLGFIVLVP